MASCHRLAKSDVWNDFVAIYAKADEAGVTAPKFLSDSVPCSNVIRLGVEEVDRFRPESEDMIQVAKLKQESAALAAALAEETSRAQTAAATLQASHLAEIAAKDDAGEPGRILLVPRPVDAEEAAHLGEVGELALARRMIHQADDADPVAVRELAELLGQRLGTDLGAQMQMVADAQGARRAQAADLAGERAGIADMAGRRMRDQRADAQRVEDRGDAEPGKLRIMGEDRGRGRPVDAGTRLQVAEGVLDPTVHKTFRTDDGIAAQLKLMDGKRPDAPLQFVVVGAAADGSPVVASVQAALGVAGLSPTAQALADAKGKSDMSAWSAVALAFLGGLILNLMPCVFPVLSLKILGFAQHAGQGEEGRSALRAHGDRQIGAIFLREPG